MPDDIIQKIALSGQNEIVDAFGGIAAAAQSAFKAIEDANISEIFAGVSLGIAGVVAGLASWAVKAADTVVEMSHLAEQAGATLQEMSSMNTALVSLGANTDDLAVVFKRLSVRLETDWPVIVKNVRDSADTMAAAQTKVQESGLAVVAAQEQISETSRKNAEQSANNALAQVGAALSVERAQDALNVALGGTHDATIALQELMLNVDKTQQAQGDLNAKIAEEGFQQRQTEIKQRLDLQKAREAEAKAIKEQSDAALKDVDMIAQALHGVDQSFKLTDVSAQDMLKGIELNAGKAAAAAKGLTGFIKPTDIQVILEMADAFKNAATASERTAISAAAFGRGIKQDVIAAFSEGSAKIRELQKAAVDTGNTLDDDMTEKAEKLHRTLNELGNGISIAATRMGILIGESGKGKDVLGALAQFVENLNTVLKHFNEITFDQVKQAAIDAVKAVGQAEIDAVKWMASFLPKTPANIPAGMASGGPVSGPGTGTSDSILARLSNGEFVIRADGSNLADAISHYVTKSFAMGGPVGIAAMAQGGPVSASHVLNLAIDGHQFNGLRAPENTFKSLSSYAVSRQLSSAGRKPSWDK